MSEKEDLVGFTLDEIADLVKARDMPRYTSKQIAEWLYKKNISSVEEMSNISKAARDQLKESYDIGLSAPEKMQVSSDGTKKYLFRVRNERFIEAVFIPEADRSTLCMSTQVGCQMGCAFCMTGKQGFHGNLSAGEILNQIISLPERDNLTNYVFMGMGEPLANTGNLLKCLEIMTSSYGFSISPSRITVSTIGVIQGLDQIISKSRCHIAVSLHTPFEDERLKIMPSEKVYPIKRVVELLRKSSIERQRRISFEYIMFKDFNDTARHVNGLTRLLNGLRCRINLIRFHPVPGVPFESSEEDTIQWFKQRLNEKGLLTTIRASRGLDILAACGMLSTRHQQSGI